MTAPVTRSVIRHLPILLIAVVLFTTIGVGLASLVPVHHTAEARLLTGQLTVSAQAVPGVVDANNSLAATYARLVDTPRFDAVLASLSEEPVPEGSVAATPIVNSPIVRIVATSADPEDAEALATRSSEALGQLVQDIDAQSQSSEAVLDDYVEASTALATATSELARERSQGGTGSAADQQAQAAVDGATLRVEALAARYREIASESATIAGLNVIQPAAPSGNSEARTLQLGGASGFSLGLIIGVGIAYLRDRRKHSRLAIS